MKNNFPAAKQNNMKHLNSDRIEKCTLNSLNKPYTSQFDSHSWNYPRIS